MRDNQESEFAGFIMELSAYWKATVSPMQCELYFNALRDLDLADIKRAASKLVRMGGTGYMPKAHELRAAADDCLPPEDRANVAWAQVVQAVGAHGYTTSVDFEDVCINAAIRSMGGWETLCHSDADWFREFAPNQFKKAYMGFAKHGCPAEMAAALPGHRFDYQKEPRRIPAMDKLQLPASQRNRPEALAAPMGQATARDMLAAIAEHSGGKAAEFLQRVAAKKEGAKP